MLLARFRSWLRQTSKKKWVRQSIAPERLRQLKTELLDEAIPDRPYFVLIIGSCLIATFGLLTNSVAVIIGAMIVAPLMLPIRALAFGALTGDVRLFRQGFGTVILGTISAVAISTMIGTLVNLSSFGSEILARSKPTLLDLGIAIAAGAISTYAKWQPKISGTLAGTAIAVALMPPICVIGLGLSRLNASLSLGATLLYLTNLLGITLACMLTFLILGCSPLRRAHKPLCTALALTALLMIPLGISFTKLVQQAQLETSLKQALLNDTLTFQRVTLLNSEINWLTTPPEVRLQVRSQDPVTPKQVRLLENFLERKTSQPFQLVFEVGEVQEVRAESPTDVQSNR
ncbi:DUF389 domain-containing protein [Leptolyngbya sp. FACHB-17]|uniref:DUF389 domain-containing protein n=1 Tax=unclassified Leptolyngbya TaxID=2650499 RepID=UPI0016800180|nr:DUF389 domain-containing protein [Leptolyngbya sp. FACHB-17]MBD2079271.1 DUF389 domain-containing protein [Leptolyngbya sp. FACHB-17]